MKLEDGETADLHILGQAIPEEPDTEIVHERVKRWTPVRRHGFWCRASGWVRDKL